MKLRKAVLIGFRIFGLLCVCVLFCGGSRAGELETSRTVYAQAIEPRAWSFPRDHGQHPGFQTEWWYFTGNLFTADAKRFGYQFTIFRRALAPTVEQSPSAWRARDVYLAHVALTDVGGRRFYSDEQLSRPALDLAGASTETMDVWVPSSSAKLDSNIVKVRSRAKEFAYDLQMTLLKPPILNGENGLDVKGEGVGQASYYYSLTRMETSGTISINGEQHRVTGLSWMDHEFGSNQLGASQVGWDWFALQLGDGSDLMLYHMRLADGTIDPASGGTYVDASGKYRSLSLDEIKMIPAANWKSKKTGASYPVNWDIEIPSLALKIRTSPALLQQELTTERTTSVTYWEGAIDVSATRNGQSSSGYGYMELTGYKEKMSGRI